MDDTRKLFDDIANAPLYGAGHYFIPGSYPKVRVIDVKIIDSMRKRGTKYAIIETEIVESRVKEYGPGDKVTQRIDLNQMSGPSNVKNFLFALGRECFEGFTAEKINGDMVAAVFGNWEGFLAQIGRKVVHLQVEAVTVQTRANTPFTKVMFAPCGVSMEDEKESQS